MFRLMKLAFYVLIGYAIYEIYQGMTEGGGGGGGGRGRYEDDDYDRGNVGQMTGPGRGMDVETRDRYGAEQTHTVGRGVVG